MNTMIKARKVAVVGTDIMKKNQMGCENEKKEFYI